MTLPELTRERCITMKNEYLQQKAKEIRELAAIPAGVTIALTSNLKKESGHRVVKLMSSFMPPPYA